MECCWDWKGSKWWKVDFHAHTPASSDYHDKEIGPREWLLNYMRAEIDCVVVTDHHSAEWIKHL